MSRCKILFSAYRKDDYADPEGYLVQIFIVLEQYPDKAIEAVTSPLTGIQRQLKFPPSIAEIVEECDKKISGAKPKPKGEYGTDWW